jgi:hypothetical protein
VAACRKLARCATIALALLSLAAFGEPINAFNPID